ncbi:MAG: hypothetical protein J1E37_08040 [Prevotella sp.]|nr:hypothetical protein [Prevotella sp.]
MKRLIFLLMATMTMAFSYAQYDDPETAKPIEDIEIERHCSYLEIDGQVYNDVIITIKSVSPDYVLNQKSKVKVTVKSESGKKVYKNTFTNSYLYIFESGQVQVGRPEFDQIVISKDGDSWSGVIKGKEGIW